MDEDSGDEDVRRKRVGDVLTMLCAELSETLTGKRLQRLRRAEAELRACIEARGQRYLTDPEVELLALERQFGSEGAIARVAGADVLIDVLVHYLQEPEWQGDDDEDRRVRMRLAQDLAATVVRLPELADFDLSCTVTEFRAAMRSAHRRLRQDQQERRLARMDPALRARIEQAIAARERRPR